VSQRQEPYPEDIGETIGNMKLLSGWKEIATYMHQGVRTVQRWELIGLPVHRVKTTSRSPVIAVGAELDAWAESSHVRVLDVVNELKVQVERLEREMRSLKHELRSAKAARSTK
jgi:hypothetical protein